MEITVLAPLMDSTVDPPRPFELTTVFEPRPLEETTVFEPPRPKLLGTKVPGAARPTPLEDTTVFEVPRPLDDTTVLLFPRPLLTEVTLEPPRAPGTKDSLTTELGELTTVFTIGSRLTGFLKFEMTAASAEAAGVYDHRRSDSIQIMRNKEAYSRAGGCCSTSSC